MTDSCLPAPRGGLTELPVDFEAQKGLTWCLGYVRLPGTDGWAQRQPGGKDGVTAVSRSWLYGPDGPLFSRDGTWGEYEPRRPAGFCPDVIVFARGARANASRETLAEAICRLYPRAQRIEAPQMPHNRVPVEGQTASQRLYRGKRMLVLGAHHSSPRLSDERENTCPNYWHFSPYGFCPFDCTYCYLAGTPGVRFCPAVKVFLNVDEMLARIDRIASRLARPTGFYVGKLQDGLALDPLTGYSRVMVPFFAAHPFARLIILTKADDASNLVHLPHGDHTILSWSLNPPEVCDQFEASSPSVGRRIEAMRRCAAAGYRVRAVIMPIIPIPGWQAAYDRFFAGLLRDVPLDRITLGGICSFASARALLEAKLGTANAISGALVSRGSRSADGRYRYPKAARIAMYGHLVESIRRRRPNLQIGLCLEERDVFERLRMTSEIGHCNCVL